MRFGLAVGLLGIGIVIISCSPSVDDSIEHSFQVSVEGGVRYAKSSSVPKFTEDLFRFERILEIKPDPQVSESILYKPRPPIVRDHEGRFHVSDAADMRIVVFNPEGNYLYQYGNMGDGPGEFRGLTLQRIHDGMVSIFDGRLFRTTEYSINGELLDVFSAPNPSPVLRGCERLPDGTIVTTVDDLRVDNTFQYKKSAIVLFSPSGDTLSTVETPYIETMFIMLEQGRRIGASALPFRAIPTTLYVPPNRILRTVGYNPVLQLFDLSGEITDLIEIDLEPTPIAPDERRQILDEYGREDEFHGVGPSPEFISSAKESMQFPEYKSFWVSVFVDSNGYFWLRYWESTYQMLVNGGPRFRVLSPDGEYLGDSRWPGSSGVIDNDLLLSWETNWDTGEFLPVIYRMVPIATGFTYP